MALALFGCGADPVVQDDIEDVGRAVDAAPAEATPADATPADATPADATPVEATCRLVWVLDHSGSMAAPLGAGDARRLDVLQGAVTDVLDEPLPIHHGLVLFAHEVLARVPPGPRAPAAIRAALDHPLGNATHYADGLVAAAELLAPGEMSNEIEDVVLLVSDGNNNGPDPYPSGTALWDLGVTVFTLDLGAGDNALLKDLSGAADRPGDPSFYFEASEPAEVGGAISAILAALPCAR